MANNKNYVLAGDVGGTKTVLALFNADTGHRKPLKKQRFSSGAYPSLAEIVKEFLFDENFVIHNAVLGVAGPVRDGHSHITNLPWVIDARDLEDQLHAPACLLNDLAATAYAIPFLDPSDILTLNPGRPSINENLGIIAPGTGLGEAFLVWSGDHYQALASEGGHVGFAPRDTLQMQLLEYLHEYYGHVSYERVCSGSGLPNIYNFLKDRSGFTEPEWLKASLEHATDPTPVIVQAAFEQQEDICTTTLDIFVDILGNEAGNLALKLLATGGIYMAGGMPARILPWLQKPDFMMAFSSKGRFTDILGNIPVQIILNPESPLMGAACYGLEMHGSISKERMGEMK